MKMNDSGNIFTQFFAWVAALASAIGFTTQDLVFMFFGAAGLLISLASYINGRVYDHNEAQKSDPNNLTKTGRLKKKARLVDGMDIKAPPGYTGGRFRGNWQVSFDAPTTDETGRVDKTGNLTKAAGNYTLSLFKVGMKAIYFCNNVPYAYRLEMGHSSQAPGGMVRITAAELQRFFEDAVREVTK